MANFTRKDNELMMEAYSVMSLKRDFPKMTLTQLTQKLPTLTLNESAYVEQFSEKVIEELFGGLKALAGGVGRAASSAGSGVMGGLKNAARGAAGAVKGAAQGAVQGVKSAAGQVGSNVKNMYNSAEDEASSKQAVKQANAAAMQLVQLVQAAQQKGLVTFSGDPMQLPLEDLIDELVLAQKGAGNISRSAQKQGVFGGAGKAFQKGFRA
jgi:phage-related protein